MLDEVADWAFILDHYNYAHWLPVHVRDMLNLENKHQDLYKQFADGFFTVAKTSNPFSLIGLEHNHKQLRKGMVGFSTLVMSVYLQSGLWQDQVIAEFEAQVRAPFPSIITRVQMSRFSAETKALVTAFQEMENPFDEDSDEITILDTEEVMPEEVVRSIMCAHEEGKKQHSAFMKEHLESQAVSFQEPIKSKRTKSLFQSTDTKNEGAVGMRTAQKITYTYLGSSTSHCKSEKTMPTACLKLKTFILVQEWQAEEWTKVAPGLMSANRLTI